MSVEVLRYAAFTVAHVGGRGGNPAGDPRWLLLSLVNHCARHDGVRAGTLITTGSCTGMIFVDAHASVEAEFENIGSVSMQFT